MSEHRRIREAQNVAAEQRTVRKMTGSSLIFALVGFCFLSCLAVVFVLNFRWIYYLDIEYLKLPEQTGLSFEVIRSNYDVLLDYNLIFGGVDILNFPSFPMSESGRIHFEEVRQIFFAIQYLTLLFGIVFLAGLYKKVKKKDYEALKLLSMLTFVIPIVLGILAAFWWDTFFTVFHKIFFKNDYWLFDPDTDPVIWILPDQFLGHCAAAVLLLLLIGGITAGVLYRRHS